MQRPSGVPLIIITGPTGVGKSDLAVALAEQCHGAVINADVGQFYTPLTIGTAKPDLKHTSVPHYLFDHIDQPINYSVAAYAADLRDQLALLENTSTLPLIVGGSCFYLYSLYRASPIAGEPSALASEVVATTPENLWEELKKIDPQRAAELHPNDHYRLQRALQIYYQTGTLASLHKPTFELFAERPFIFIHLTRERPELLARIEQRLRAMLAGGWIQEVEALAPEWKTFLRTKGIIGYPEILNYLEAAPSLSVEQEALARQELFKKIFEATAQYAKRQETFFRKIVRDQLFVSHAHAVRSFTLSASLTLSDVALYIRQML